MREWREKRGLTQEQMAQAITAFKMLGADISNYERATSKRRWNEDHLYEFARVLKVEPWWLLGADPTDPSGLLPFVTAYQAIPPARRAAALRVLEAFAENDEKPVIEKRADPTDRARRRP